FRSVACKVLRSGNYDSVAVFQEDVLFQTLPLKDVLVVELNSLRAANNDDLFPVREIPEAPCVGKRIEDLGGRRQSVFAGAIHFAGDIKLLAADRLQADRHVRAVDEIRKRLLQLFAQTLGRQTAGLNVP